MIKVLYRSSNYLFQLTKNFNFFLGGGKTIRYNTENSHNKTKCSTEGQKPSHKGLGLGLQIILVASDYVDCSCCCSSPT